MKEFTLYYYFCQDLSKYIGGGGGFHLAFPIKWLLKLFHLLTLTNASIFSRKSGLSQLFIISFCLQSIAVELFIVSSFFHKLPLFHLDVCFAVCLRFCQICCGWLYRRLAVKSWIRAWTGLWGKLLIQAGTNIDWRVRFGWHDSGDMPKSSCSWDL